MHEVILAINNNTNPLTQRKKDTFLQLTFTKNRHQKITKKYKYETYMYMYNYTLSVPSDSTDPFCHKLSGPAPLAHVREFPRKQPLELILGHVTNTLC